MSSVADFDAYGSGAGLASSDVVTLYSLLRGVISVYSHIDLNRLRKPHESYGPKCMVMYCVNCEECCYDTLCESPSHESDSIVQFR